ncbi:MAG: hypothetical protein KC442_11085 [Thermomicrobiales bacterium]|nr:hypothetical protein [Thermomicrobiales bacterium]
MTFDQLVGRFSGFPDASARLQGWGWQASAYRQFGCNGPPEGDAGWIDISVHGLGSAAAAQEAADYFAMVRVDGTSLIRADGPGVGDYSVAVTGPASNGKEFTVYATRGPWLVRVTGVSPSGIPFMNVRLVAQDVLAAQSLDAQAADPSACCQGAEPLAVTAASVLPGAPDVNYAECFRTHARGTYAAREVDEAFAATGIGSSATTTYGWRDGAYVVFRCDNPPFGRALQLDVVVHQFSDDTSARQVLPYVDAFFAAGDRASRACDTAGPMVICVTGYANTGSPLSDTYFVLNQVVAAAR